MFSFPVSIAFATKIVHVSSYLKALSFDFDRDEAAMGDLVAAGFETCSAAWFVLLAFQP